MTQGRPVSPTSLASKIATLDVGESIWLTDTETARGATNMERQVTTLFCRSPMLKNRKFATTRADAITVQREHHHLLRVERVA